MTDDHGLLFFFSLLLQKEVREKENKVAKIVIKSHAFLLDQKLHLPKLIPLHIFPAKMQIEKSHVIKRILNGNKLE